MDKLNSNSNQIMTGINIIYYNLVDSILYEFSIENENRISFLFEYSKFLKEKKISDAKINEWQNRNLSSTANTNLENLNKKVSHSTENLEKILLKIYLLLLLQTI